MQLRFHSVGVVLASIVLSFSLFANTPENQDILEDETHESRDDIATYVLDGLFVLSRADDIPSHDADSCVVEKFLETRPAIIISESQVDALEGKEAFVLSQEDIISVPYKKFIEARTIKRMPIPVMQEDGQTLRVTPLISFVIPKPYRCVGFFLCDHDDLVTFLDQAPKTAVLVKSQDDKLEELLTEDLLDEMYASNTGPLQKEMPQWKVFALKCIAWLVPLRFVAYCYKKGIALKAGISRTWSRSIG